ncbi:alpha/beta hydrolase, partial [Listeria monocytogenes]|nr:alpha/beta hydrolase [Listeria monocytogenes]
MIRNSEKRSFMKKIAIFGSAIVLFCLL